MFTAVANVIESALTEAYFSAEIKIDQFEIYFLLLLEKLRRCGRSDSPGGSKLLRGLKTLK